MERLDEDALVVVAGHLHGGEHELGAVLELNLWLVMPLHVLAREVLHAQRQVQLAPNALVVRCVRRRHGREIRTTRRARRVGHARGSTRVKGWTTRSRNVRRDEGRVEDSAAPVAAARGHL